MRAGKYDCEEREQVNLRTCPMLRQSSLAENVHWTFSVAVESARGTYP